MVRGIFYSAVLSIGTVAAFAAHASSPWPAEAWTSAQNLSAYDAESGNDLSGAVWNPDTRQLWLCRNGPGGNASKIWVLSESSPLSFSIATRDGNAGEWTGFGDLEGLTIADYGTDTLYGIVEGEEKIREYDLSTYGTIVLRNTWNTSAFLPRSGGAGAEGITFVPDTWLAASGFVDGSGAPYSSQNGMGGLMFVAHQNGGRIYVFDLDRSDGSFDFVGAYTTGYTESCGLEFDRSTGHLHIWHGNANDLEVVSLASAVDGTERRFTQLAYFDLQSYGNFEGIALSPAAEGEKLLFMTRDDGGADALRMFVNFDTGLDPIALDVDAPEIVITEPAAGSGPEYRVGTSIVHVAGYVQDAGAVVRMSCKVTGATGTRDGTVVTDAAGEQTLVAAGGLWRYFDDGSDLGTQWRGNGFDDQTWAYGPAPLGYGDGDEATVIGYGSDPNNKPATTYYRHCFVLESTDAIVSDLTLRVQRDDGAVVFLNGVEILRDNLPANPAFNTWAYNSVTDDGNAWLSTNVAASLLVAGTNTISVEIHQSYPASSDSSFDLVLTAPVGGVWRVPDLDLDEGTNDIAVVACDDAGNGSTNTLLVVFDRDIDDDGLDDAWETRFFGDTEQSDGGDADFDRDGFSDAAELAAGTDPTSRASRLVFTSVAVLSSGAWVFSWQSVEGRSYTLRAATNLVCGFDQLAASDIVATPPLNTYTAQVDTACHMQLALTH